MFACPEHALPYFIAMPSNNLWERIRGARIFQVLIVYLGASWVVMQVAETLQESLSLPEWLRPVAFLLLLVGLVIILATAWIQGSPGTAAKQQSGELPGSWDLAPKEVGEALKAGRLPHLTWSRSILGGIFAFWFLFGLAGIYVVIKDRGESFAPPEAVATEAGEGIAIVPFTVRGEDLDVWREGMMDVFATSLDDVGGYRTISSRTVMARWKDEVAEGEEADLATARNVAKRSGAKYVMTGSAVALGDNVRLAADIYDVETGEEIGASQVEGPADSVLVMVDQLGVEVMQALMRSAGAEGLSVRQTQAIVTASLPALRAYLRAEALFRNARFERAIEAYEEALEIDPEMSLAHARVADAYGWIENIGSDKAAEHFEYALAHLERLPSRERTLVQANAAVLAADLDGVEPLRAATRKYPNDPEAWFLLGEFYLHYMGQLLLEPEDARRAFDRAIELDPSFAPYYLHAVEGAIIQRDTARVDQLLEQLEPLRASRTPALLLSRDLILGDSATQAAAVAALDTVDDAVLRDIYPDLWLSSGRPVAMMPVFDELTDRRDPAGERKGWLYFMAGQPEAGAGLFPPWIEAVFVDLTIRPLPEEDFAGYPWDGCGLVGSRFGVWCTAMLVEAFIRSGESQSLDSLVMVQLPLVQEEMRRNGFERYEWFIDVLAEGIRAYEISVTDPAASIEALEAIQGTGSSADHWIRYWLMRLHDSQGNTAETIRYLESLRFSGLDSWVNFRLGELYEQTGERQKARDAYVRFLQAWEEAEPNLPQTDQARAALENLLRG
jgi:tetratricopeptide (TPR) repeat protein/TolB-like protein